MKRLIFAIVYELELQKGDLFNLKKISFKLNT